MSRISFVNRLPGYNKVFRTHLSTTVILGTAIRINPTLIIHRYSTKHQRFYAVNINSRMNSEVTWEYIDEPLKLKIKI